MTRLTWLLSAAAMLLSSVAMADTVPPDVLVKTTATEVLDIVKKDKEIQNGDMKKIVALTEEKILPHFNFDRMSQLVLGRNWTKASKDQQDKFVRERSIQVGT